MAEILVRKKYMEKVCPLCQNVRLEEAFPVGPSNPSDNLVYSSLASAERQIRLLRILSGSEEQPLECVLEPASLEECQYTALSYCWGSASDRKNIMVNGQTISVTKNLENALRHLRKADQEIVVWADAICINQQDLAEKSIQVGMMGNIYSNGTSLR